MKKVVPIILLLFVTGGITYALRSGVLRSGDKIGNQAPGDRAERANGQVTSSGGKEEKKSSKDKRKKRK